VVLEWSSQLLKETHKYAAAVKFNSAFYEALGPEGLDALDRSINVAKGYGLLVILDAKRGDIGSTVRRPRPMRPPSSTITMPMR